MRIIVQHGSFKIDCGSPNRIRLFPGYKNRSSLFVEKDRTPGLELETSNKELETEA